MRPGECPQTDTHTHTHGQTQNDFIICPMLYAIAMGQIMIPIATARLRDVAMVTDLWRVLVKLAYPVFILCDSI